MSECQERTKEVIGCECNITGEAFGRKITSEPVRPGRTRLKHRDIVRGIRLHSAMSGTSKRVTWKSKPCAENEASSWRPQARKRIRIDADVDTSSAQTPATGTGRSSEGMDGRVSRDDGQVSQHSSSSAAAATAKQVDKRMSQQVGVKEGSAGTRARSASSQVEHRPARRFAETGTGEPSAGGGLYVHCLQQPPTP